jgi:predicted small secreted protein
MKKITGLFAVLAVLSMLSSGCGTTASSGGGDTSSLPVSSAASAVGYLATTSVAYANISSLLGGVSSAGISTKSMDYSFVDGWLTMYHEDSMSGFGSFSYDLKAKLFGASTGPIDSESKLEDFVNSGDDLTDIYQFSVIEFDITSPEAMSFVITLGSSKASPLKLENLTTAPSVTGPASYSGTYGAENVSVTMNYDGLTVSASDDYPTGSVSFTVVAGTTPAYSGNITFYGTDTATIEFDGGGSYSVNLTTGAVS